MRKNLTVLLWYLITVLFIFFINRMLLLIFFHNSISDLIANDYFTLFAVSARFDFAIAGYLSIPYLICYLSISGSDRVNRIIHNILVCYTTLTIFIIFFLEFSTFRFMEEYAQRPNRLMFEFLNHPVEVFSTLFKLTGPTLIILILGSIISAIAAFKIFSKLLKNIVIPGIVQRAIILPLLLVLCIFFARGSRITGRPLVVADSDFSNNLIANQIAINSPYTFFDALKRFSFEKNSKSIYGFDFKDRDIIETVKRNITIPENAYLNDANNPFLHIQKPVFKRKRPLNLVIILEESMGAEFVGCLDGRPLTPNFCALSKKGIFFKNLYSTGVRSAHGIEAVLCGFLPSPNEGVIKLGLSQYNFFTGASLLQQHGYNTSFIYGGDSTFDNMRSFAIKNGFKEIIDERDFDNNVFHGTWGVADEFVMDKAIDWFSSQKGPFFSLIFTTSNHGPFEFPDGRIELYESPKASVNNTVKYADYSIGYFFKKAEKYKFFNDTAFLIVADHNWRSFGSNYVPIDKMRIPGLIIAPGVSPRIIEEPASQVDLLPTMLSIMGLQNYNPMIGEDLTKSLNNYKGRAYLQFYNHYAYLEGEDVVMYLTNGIRKQFKWSNGSLKETSLDIDFANKALAFALLPDFLYRNKAYHCKQ
jgi:phosphoglycerol transferase MdoB-like AlkP superfamily enzyme